MKTIKIVALLVIFLISSLTVFAQITIAPENRCSTYQRSDYYYPQWIELDIIEKQSGRIISPYTNQEFSNRGLTEIEHIVALSEAHDSGLCAVSAARRREFSQDLDNLTLASPTLNKTKSDNDLAEWLPPENACWYVQTVVNVKAKYGLSMDQKEAEAAVSLLERCLPDLECEAEQLADTLNCYTEFHSIEEISTDFIEASVPNIDPNSCFPHTTAYVTGKMNIRSEASTSSDIVDIVQSGSFTVLETTQGTNYCWLRISNGWLADTGYVTASDPGIVQPVQQPSNQSAPAPQQPSNEPVVNPTPVPIQPQPTAFNALAAYDDNGNGRITCAEARAHGIAPVPAGHPAYQYMDDRDNDGVVCE